MTRLAALQARLSAACDERHRDTPTITLTEFVERLTAAKAVAS